MENKISNFQPLKVTAYLMDGRIATYDGYLPLDGIMASVEMQRLYPLERNEKPYFIPLPMKRIKKEGNIWWWACSFACFEPKCEGGRYWHKRFDQELAADHIDFGKRRGTIDIKSAQHKNYRIKCIYVLTPKIEWYCVASAHEIEPILRRITHIGKKPSQGFGEVREWTIEAWPEDLSWLRPTPDENGDDYVAIKPPYFYRENMYRVKWPDDIRIGALAMRGM